MSEEIKEVKKTTKKPIEKVEKTEVKKAKETKSPTTSETKTKKSSKTKTSKAKAQEFLGTGRRKCSVARVRITTGRGKSLSTE